MSTIIDIRELLIRWEEALFLTLSGSEVILTDGSVPRARLVPCEKPRHRVAGLHIGAMQAATDFDTPISMIQDKLIAVE